MPPPLQIAQMPEVIEAVRTEARAAMNEALRQLDLPAVLSDLRRFASPMMSAAEVAERFGCSVRQLHEYHVAQRGLPRYGTRQNPVFITADVLDYLRRYPLGPPSPEENAEEYAASSRPS